MLLNSARGILMDRSAMLANAIALQIRGFPSMPSLDIFFLEYLKGLQAEEVALTAQSDGENEAS